MKIYPADIPVTVKVHYKFIYYMDICLYSSKVRIENWQSCWKVHIVKNINQDQFRKSLIGEIKVMRPFLYELGHEILTNEVSTNSFGMIWPKGHKLARHSLYLQMELTQI